MAIVRAIKSGNWSDPTVWNTGTLPTSADDVYSNNFAIVIDISITVLSISNNSATGVTAGGGFTASNNTLITCTAAVGMDHRSGPGLFTSNLATGQSVSIIGTVQTVTGASFLSAAIANNGSGTINITGNVTCVSGGQFGAVNNSTGVINITGEVRGGLAANSIGVQNSAAGIVNITGNCIAGSSGPAVNNASTGVVTIVGQLTPSTGVAAFTSSNTNAVNILTGPFLVAANGITAVYAMRWFWQNTTPPATFYQIRSANLAVVRPLYTADSVGGNPAANNVRSGTIYGPNNELTGTCAVPPAGSVALGVPVDATTGTAAISAASIRSAVGLAAANLDTQLAGIAAATPPTAAAIASVVWSAVNRTITGGTVDTLTNAPSVPTPSQIASQVRTELATELARIDAPVSGALTPSDTLARVTLVDSVTTLINSPNVPTGSEIAEAVREELMPELERVSNCATVQTTGDQIAALQ